MQIVYLHAVQSTMWASLKLQPLIFLRLAYGEKQTLFLRTIGQSFDTIIPP